MGGGLQGCELAEFLAKCGRKVTIVESGDMLGEGMVGVFLGHLMVWFQKKGVIAIAGAKEVEITKKGVIVTTKDGKRSTIEADTVVPAIPFSANMKLFNSLEGKVPEVYDAVPADLDVHLVLDNYGTHKTPLIQRWLAKRSRYHLHFTPTGASWINQVERWFAALTEKQLRRSAHRSTRELELAIQRYLEITNKHTIPFKWTKTADQILATVARFCKRINDSGH